ncbi:Protein S100-A11 [Plecturocebus cupreus]
MRPVAPVCPGGSRRVQPTGLRGDLIFPMGERVTILPNERGLLIKLECLALLMRKFVVLQRQQDPSRALLPPFNGKGNSDVAIPLGNRSSGKILVSLHSLPRASLSSNMAKISSPTETERCIESLTAVFQRYAGKDGYNYTLSKTEFLSFMNTELAAFTKNQKEPGVLDRMMKKLDTNSDGQLGFSEFLNLTGGLAMACHDSFLKAVPSQKRT